MAIPRGASLGRRFKPLRRQLRARWLRLRGREDEAAFWLARMVPGMFRHDEIRLLYRTVRACRGPGDICEIGSWKGRTTVIMGLALRDAGQDRCRIYAVDHHEGGVEVAERYPEEGSSLQVFRANLARAGIADRVEELVMFSREAAPLLRERGVELRMLFIDGAHDEESVREDIRRFVPLVGAGGIVALHDCEAVDAEHPGVWRAYQAELAGRVDEVARASSLLVTRLRASAAPGT